MLEFTLDGEEYTKYFTSYYRELIAPLEDSKCENCNIPHKQYLLRTSELDMKRYCRPCTQKLFHIDGGIYKRKGQLVSEIGKKSRPRMGFDPKSVRETHPFTPTSTIKHPEELFLLLSKDICVYSVMCPEYKADDLQKFLDGWFSKYRIQILP